MLTQYFRHWKQLHAPIPRSSSLNLLQSQKPPRSPPHLRKSLSSSPEMLPFGSWRVSAHQYCILHSTVNKEALSWSYHAWPWCQWSCTAGFQKLLDDGKKLSFHKLHLSIHLFLTAPGMGPRVLYTADKCSELQLSPQFHSESFQVGP